MLVAFFKSHSDINSKCVVVKFVDRIWLETSGDLNCIRTFILHVEDGDPLHDIRMLIPFRNTPNLTDLSEICLNEGYLYNDPNFSSGGYNVKNINSEGNCGRVVYDYFDTEVHTDNLVKSFLGKCKDYQVIEFDFKNNPIRKGEYRLIRLSFSVTSILDKILPRVSSLKLGYFIISNTEEFDMMEIKKLEVPVMKIFDPETKKGGFDIFLHFPSDKMANLSMNACTFTSAKHKFDGTISDILFHKLIWRARLLFPEDAVKLIRAGEHPFSAEGLIGDPKELEEIRSEVEVIKSNLSTVVTNLSTVVKGLKIAKWIAISGVIIAFISLIISFLFKR